MQIEFIHQDAKNRKLTDVDRRTIRRISRKVGAAARKEKLSESKANLDGIPEPHVVQIDDTLDLLKDKKRVSLKSKKVGVPLGVCHCSDLEPAHPCLVVA